MECCEWLLQAAEHTGYSQPETQPDGIADHITLLPYQLQSLQWMMDMESLPGGLNSLFWEERAWLDGGTYYYSPALGNILDICPAAYELVLRRVKSGKASCVPGRPAL